MAGEQTGASEITPAYRTLDEPTKLIGLSIAQWGAIVITGGIAYLWLLVSPLPWRLNISLVVVLLGAPLLLAVLREQCALSTARLFAAVCRWRFRPALLLEVDPEQPPEGGAVVLDEPIGGVSAERLEHELPWLDPDPEEDP